jgi:selenide, water dikinase
VGTATSDDAGVFRISDSLALIQTVDFFNPIVDDPYHFGRIAAANSLSDVYAMGGTPKTAMNIVAYPMKKMGLEPLREMLAGGSETVREAGAVLLGGHSVEDDELKYGLSVTGFIHPEKILKNQGLCNGDLLVLTKPLGTGIINTAIKGGLASEMTIKEVIEIMATLNKKAAEVMSGFPVSACTDVTGFGLLGHLAEMIQGCGVKVTIHTKNVPLIRECYEYGAMGFVPVGSHNNRAFRKNMVRMAEDFDPVMRDILFDPQTSGGLLIGCKEKHANVLVQRLKDEGVEAASIIGEVGCQEAEMIYLK